MASSNRARISRRERARQTDEAAQPARRREMARALDADLIAARIAALSGVVAAAGSQEIAEGAVLIAAADNVGIMSAMLGLMGAEDVELGLEAAAMSGEASVLSEVLNHLELPVISSLLGERSHRLRSLSVELLLSGAAARALATVMAATGAELREVGADEIAEGVLRQAAAKALAAESVELTLDGVVLDGREDV